MLRVVIPAVEFFDESKNEFLQVKEHTLVLEHSLVSLSKWEAKTNKPFLSKDPKTREETIEYIRCMTITQNVDPNIYYHIPASVLEKINNYISAPMTATWFSNNRQNNTNREIVTSEVIYYWMISLGIPFECQKWHLNRLFTLIRVCNEKNAKPKKMSKRELASRNASLNAARRKAMRSRG